MMYTFDYKECISSTPVLVVTHTYI